MEILLNSTLRRPQTVFPEEDPGILLRYFFLEQEESNWQGGRNLLARTQERPWLAPAQYPNTDIADGTNLAFFFIDQEESCYQQGRQKLARTQDQPWLVPPQYPELDEAESYPLQYFFLDQEEPSRTPVQTRPWVPWVYPDEDAGLAPTATINFDQEEPGWPLPSIQTTPWLIPSRYPELDEAEMEPLEFFYLEQEEPWTPWRQSQPWLPFVTIDEDPTPILAFFYLEQEETEYPIGRRQFVPWLAPSGYPTLDEDPTQPLAFFFLDQEEFWKQTVQTVPWLARPFGDEDGSANLAYFYSDQEEPSRTPVQSRPWTPWTFADEDAGFPPATTIPCDQDDAWPILRQAQPWLPISAAPKLDEAETTGLANFYVDQEEPWLAKFQLRPWLPFTSLDNHEAPPLAFFYSDQEEPGWPLARVSYLPWSAKIFADEDPWPLQILYLDQEEYWTAQVQTRPWTAIGFRDEDPALGVVPFGLDQEDAWTAQTVAYRWIAPAVFPYDDAAQAKPFPRTLPSIQWQATRVLTAIQWSVAQPTAIVWSGGGTPVTLQPASSPFLMVTLPLLVTAGDPLLVTVGQLASVGPRVLTAIPYLNSP